MYYIGKQLRQILLHHDGFVSSRAEMFMYLAIQSSITISFSDDSIKEHPIILQFLKTTLLSIL